MSATKVKKGARKYECGVCKRDLPREMLMAKKVGFFTIGAGGRTIKSRTVHWVCGDCVRNDPDWQREKYSDAPGSTNFEEIGELQPNG